MIEKKDGKSSLLIKIMLILIAAGSILAAIKCIFVGLQMDEEYAYTLSYRLIKGDRLLTQVWDPHQTSAFLYISIRDTGIGMPEKELERLNGTLSMTPFKTEQAKEEEPAPGGQKHTGIALKNVAQRIKLLFGNEYGLTVFSTQGVGTNVVITLPRQESVTPDGRS